MSDLYELHARPELDRPVLVLALEGWIDAGFAGAAAARALVEQLDTTVVATFDPDRFIDYRARRPIMHLVDGVNTGLTWSTIELRAGSDPSGNDLLLLVGAEPDHAWHAFTEAAVGLAVELGAHLALGLGAYPAAVPHTRPSLLVATATTSDLAHRIGYVPGKLDVPAGIAAAIERRCDAIGLPAAGLWAQVPHYAAAMPYPAAAVTLVEGLVGVGGLDLDASALRVAAAATRVRIDQLVTGSEEHQALVRQLESQFDAEAPAATGPPTRMPSGDELAAELERFLRDQGSG